MRAIAIALHWSNHHHLMNKFLIKNNKVGVIIMCGFFFLSTSLYPLIISARAFSSSMLAATSRFRLLFFLLGVLCAVFARPHTHTYPRKHAKDIVWEQMVMWKMYSLYTSI